MPGPRESLLSAAPLLFGATLGLFIVFYDVVRRRLVNEGTWIKRDINTDADGKTAEHLAGHYLPFGPFLAVGALVMLFAGRPVLTWLAARFFPML
jgi:prepilin signal peptidase PulO-like enzyme (type II secretory pathway)